MAKQPLADKKIVKQLLEAYPESRDDEQRLYELYTASKGVDPQKTTLAILFYKIKRGKIRSFDTVTRFSRMLQKEHDALKGKNWGKRKVKEKEVTAQIRSEKKLDINPINSNIDERNRRQDTQPAFL